MADAVRRMEAKLQTEEGNKMKNLCQNYGKGGEMAGLTRALKKG